MSECISRHHPPKNKAGMRTRSNKPHWPLVSQLQFTHYHFTLDLSTYESRVIMMQNIEMILRGIINRSVHEIRSMLRVIYKSPLRRVYYKKLVKVAASPPREQSSLKKTEVHTETLITLNKNKPYYTTSMFYVVLYFIFTLSLLVTKVPRGKTLPF